MKGIFISDWHFHWWPTYNENGRRLKSQMKSLTRIFKLAYTNDVPVFFGGDLFHSPAALTNKTLSLVLPFLIDLFYIYPIKLYAISGNHDQSEINNISHRSPTYINTIANSIKDFYNIDFDKVEFDDFVVYGVPYINFNEGYDEYIKAITPTPGKANILLNHTDYLGQQDTNGIIIGKGLNINEKKLKKFDLVVSGHVHKAQRLRQNIYIIGSPQQLRLSDMGGTFGYWILRDDFSMSFKELDKTPKFRYYKEDSDKTNSFDFWVKEAMTREELADEIQTNLDPEDRMKVVNAYLKFVGERSKVKKRFLRSLIHKVDD